MQDIFANNLVILTEQNLPTCEFFISTISDFEYMGESLVKCHMQMQRHISLVICILYVGSIESVSYFASKENYMSHMFPVKFKTISA